MGYYIEVPVNLGKAQYLRDHADVRDTTATAPIAETDVRLCVVQNGLFDAIGICYDDSERDAFNDLSDPRPKDWLVTSKSTALELYGERPNTPQLAELLNVTLASELEIARAFPNAEGTSQVSSAA